MSITPFRGSHLLTIAPTFPCAQAYGLEGYPSETVWTRSGKVIGCYGCVLPSPGRGILWVVVGPHAMLHPLPFVRGFCRGMKRVVEDYGLWRLELVVDPTNPRAVALVTRLGFAWEGRLEAYGPEGQPFDQYCWIAKKERAHDR